MHIVGDYVVVTRPLHPLTTKSKTKMQSFCIIYNYNTNLFCQNVISKVRRPSRKSNDPTPVRRGI